MTTDKNHNTGESNTGDHNIGDYNSGDHNTGYYNSGHRNTGDYNSGYYNSGHRNTGDYNTGDYNSGYYNSGDYNSGAYHVGCFNTINPEKAYYFNKLIDKKLWDNAKKPRWILNPKPFAWVSSREMTTREKQENPNHEITGGYLRRNDMKEEWRKAYDNATPEDIELTKQLPAFDVEVFLEITGVDLREPKAASCEGREIEIDGVTYVLKEKKIG